MAAAIWLSQIAFWPQNSLLALLYNFAVSWRARPRFFVVLLFCISLAPSLFAEKVADLHPTGYVDDFAHVIDQPTTQQITDICTQIDQKAHAQIALVTINTLDGEDLESFSIDLAQKWGVGGKGKDDKDRGVLILYVIKDHRARIEVGYGLEPILPDGKVGGFQREAIPLMRSQQYSQALLLVTSRVAQTIADDAGIQLTNAPPPAPVRQYRHDEGGGISLGGIIIFVVIILIVLATPLRSLLFWILFSNIFGGRGGGFGGGGFGGFGGGGGGSWGGGGGGGGFGGFGGGSFGGGGASSSW